MTTVLSFYPISPSRVMILPAGKLWGWPFGETERFGLGCSWHAWRRVNRLWGSGKACRRFPRVSGRMTK
jgi:hypothetical protein